MKIHTAYYSISIGDHPTAVDEEDEETTQQIMTDTEAITEEHRAKVANYVELIESKLNIEILVAVDNGSRAKGIHTPQSDCDVKCIWRYNKRSWHMASYHPKDFGADTMLEGVGKGTVFEDGMYDFSGWSVDKAIDLLTASNPSLIEWIYSPVVYVDKLGLLARFRALVEEAHNKISIYVHYVSMARTNFKTFIQGKKDVEYKKYVYVFQPLEMVLRLENMGEGGKLVEHSVPALHKEVQHLIPEEVNEEILEAIRLKQTMKGVKGPRLPKLDEWAEEQIDRMSKVVESLGKKKGATVTACSAISNYDKMRKEVKKLLDISGKAEREGRDEMNRANYLAAIFSVLQFLWVWTDPERNMRDMPTSITGLLAGIPDVPQVVQEEIKTVVDFKDTVEPGQELVEARKTIWDAMVPGVVKLARVVDPEFDESTMVPRDDSYEFVLSRAMEIKWLLESGEKMRKIPKKIFQPGAFEKEFGKKLRAFAGSLKMRYYMPILPKLNEWMRKMVEEHGEPVKQYSVKLQQIKEINALARFKDTIKKMGTEVVDQLREDYLWS